MTSNLGYLIDLIFEKLKKHKNKEIFLEKKKFREICIFTFK